MSRLPNKHTTILLGDFNAQLGTERKFRGIVGDYPAHKRTTRNGERLISLCRENNLVMRSTFYRHHPKKQTTWAPPNPHIGEKQIDHVAISRSAAKDIMNVRVMKGANLDSDHYLSKIKFKANPLIRKCRPSNIKKFDIQKIETNGFKTKLETKSSQNWNEIKKNMINTAKETIPLNKKRKHAWWNEECEKLLQIRQKAWNKHNSNKNSITFFEELKEKRKLAKKGFKKAREQQLKNQLTEIETSFTRNNTRDFYKIFKKSLLKYQPPSLQFKDPKTSKMAFNNTDNCRILAEYFTKLHNCEPTKDTFEFHESKSSKPNSEPPDQNEIQNIIKSLKNNKAAGEDNIVAEFWKHADTKTIEQLTKIIQNIWETEKLPTDWTSALIHPLHKKGSKTDPNNYRGISLLPVTYKILSKALLTRAEVQLDHQLGEYQGGFRKSRSCAEQIINLKNIMDIKRVRNLKYVVTFVD